MLLSLPFLWGGQLTGMFQVPISIPLLRVAWWISADGQVGFTALRAINRHGGSPEAIGCAMAWMERHPRVELSAYAGLLAAGEGLADIARDMSARCGQFATDRLGLTELLEFTIAKRFEPFGAAADCARRLEDRNDLSGTVSAMIHTELLWDAMLGGRLTEAQRRAEFILSVGDAPEAHVALAALAKYHGNESGASRHLDQAKLPPTEMHYYCFLSACAIGADEDAREHLAALDDHNVSLAKYAACQVNAARGNE
ncbi:MAG: hypothetical protein ISS69_13890 [Phycisphaerae bacterium]|nr:hypothetical protein [Phycisphaerae bacterium]